MQNILTRKIRAMPSKFHESEPEKKFIEVDDGKDEK